ncbi:MAG: purine-nucleoside phosphorylase [Pirellulaceae bacterium]
MNPDSVTVIEMARARIFSQWPVQPEAALILGTGLGRLVEHVQSDVTIPFAALLGFPPPTALGHCGRVVCGHLNGMPLLLLDGRCHLYEGYSLEQVTLPVRVLHACGVRLLITSNASGGLNPKFASGDIMVIDDHLNLMSRTVPPLTCDAVLGRAVRTGSSPYDEQLLEQVLRIAHRNNFVAHRGVYVGMTGPNYETRAEYRFLRRIGGDVVGMSTIPEAVVAHALGMRVLGLSVVTNVATPDTPQIVDASDVVDAAARAEPHVRQIVAGIVAQVRAR